MIVALGGLTLGYLVYRGYAARAQSETLDPLAGPLGGLYRVLQNKYYFDELYYKVFVKGSQRLANWLFKFDDTWIIDPIVDGVGKLGRRLSEVGHWFDVNIVDAIVNGVGSVTGAFGSALRLLQTGKAQNYLFTVLLVLSVALGVFLLLPK
jgi:NADH-quinone oxidoreductase subunit L